ncbi:Zn-dependent exopeptidase [Dichomitus squalens LYAD-421 SS1]|uniref:Zn-dependent exopeptidase n=1 Tax=Dichomitus squalens (strain LYAD-421) TaxID=732165 RepID=UPI0004415BBA|nr:Zn-dependent exopeptidase [Dichomitus squalens LYAD-421 SS1]EJF64229.1 Zn-dependent exopeptidase [Dichomitus squalens LYAD-421 SS1]
MFFLPWGNRPILNKPRSSPGGALPPDQPSELCPQAQTLLPVRHAKLAKKLESVYATNGYKLRAYKALEGAIRIPEIGSDPFLLPVLMTAHQDVVPVDNSSAKDWVHPPYSGYYDGKHLQWIWGRGSCDDKSDLVAQLHAISALVEAGFKPKRSFVWAFGFDEEAMTAADSYGRPYGDDVIFATPYLAEKGYIDVRIEVTAKGGHSSVPPPHTAIGVLSAMIVALEDHPHEAQLIRGGSPYNSTMCAATYGPTFPEDLRHWFKKGGRQRCARDADTLEELKDALIETFPQYNAILRTTQAVDLVSGGVKVNALPELAAAVVNHRIAQHESPVDVQAHIKHVLFPVAEHFNLTMDAFGYWEPAGDGSGGHVKLTDAWDASLEPSPVTPTGPEDPYQIFAGTIKATLESAEAYNATGVVVAPQLILGNTDTQYYWGLTKNIFRYSHLSNEDFYNGLHTINEAVRGEAWIQSIRFYTQFILNCDEHLKVGNF